MLPTMGISRIQNAVCLLCTRHKLIVFQQAGEVTAQVSLYIFSGRMKNKRCQATADLCIPLAFDHVFSMCIRDDELAFPLAT